LRMMEDIIQHQSPRIPKSLDSSLVEKAVQALLKHVNNVKQKGKQKQPLFEEDNFINLVISLRTIPEKTSIKPRRIAIPHGLQKEDAEVCIFVKDPQDDIKKVFEENGVKLAKVIGLAKLRSNYKEFEAKRNLCSSYDLFLADSRIINYLPKLLGKAFFKKKRQPIPVELAVGSKIPKEIEKAKNSTYLFFGGGACNMVKIARTSFSTEEIVQNILTGVENIVKKLPQRWRNVQAIYIKTNESVSLPIFNSLPQKITRINPSSNTQEEQAEEETVEEELATKKRKSNVSESKSVQSTEARSPKKAKIDQSAVKTNTNSSPVSKKAINSKKKTNTKTAS